MTILSAATVLTSLLTATAIGAASQPVPAPRLLAAATPKTPAKKAPAKKAPKEKPAPQKTPKKETPDTAAKLTAKVQAFYEKTVNFTAHFEQRYTYQVLGRSTKSAGTVAFKKPGLMRWDYETPRKKLFVVDGDTLWVYTPEDHTVIKRPDFKPDSLSSSITFLWGKGKLDAEFDITLVDETTLKLVPKTPQAGFASLRFRVEPKTGKVLESTVIDAQGNTNRLGFTDVKLDAKLPASKFTFTPPKGVSVQILDATGLH